MRRALIDLKPDEEVLGLVRASLRSKIGTMLFISLWVLLPFFFFFPLLALGLFGLVFFGVLILSGTVRAIVFWRNWYGTLMIITDDRIIDIERKGMFAENRTEIMHHDLLDAVVEPRGLLQRLTGVGAVRVRTTKALSYEVVFSGVSRPQHVADLINDVQYMTAPSSSASFHVAKKQKR